MSKDQPYHNIPGTVVFDSSMARKGYHVNQFCMSLMKEENRSRFRKDERAYLDEWGMTEEQKEYLLERNYNKLLGLGGNIYFLAKLFFTDEVSFEQAAAGMTGVSTEEYRAMMLGGGRTPTHPSTIKR